jgi:hypothetical protein
MLEALETMLFGLALSSLIVAIIFILCQIYKEEREVDRHEYN